MMFAQNRVLDELDLLMSEIHPEQVDVFAPIQSTLANNDVQTRGSAMILQACVDTQLRELNLSGNHLKDDAGGPFSRFLTRSQTIRVLNLSGNNLTVRFTSVISESLGSSTTLEALDLSNSPLASNG
jgi:Ran GTPase-activating protein (RanGAP) involved in mRNA processing and transport